jgi:PAS domain S-box-containing protein
MMGKKERAGYGKDVYHTDRTPLGFALLVGVCYLAVGSLYIIISSSFLGREPIPRGSLVQWEILKGLIYVVLSAVILFLLVYRFSLQMENRRKLLSDVFHLAGLPVVLMDAEPPHRIRLANEAAMKMLPLEALEAEQFMHPILETMFPDESGWQDVSAGRRQSASWAATLETANGLLPVEVRLQRAPQNVGGRPALLMVILDVSERELAQEELLRREHRFRLAMNQYPFPGAIVDRHERLTFVNEAFSRVTGMSYDQMVGRTYVELGAPNAAAATGILREAVATGEVRSEIMMDDFGDPPLIYEVLVTPLKADDGTVLESLVLTRDVSEHVRREEAVRRHERTLWALIEALPIPVCLGRHETGEILVANQAFNDLYDLDGDLNRLSVKEVYQDPSDRSRILDQFEREGSVIGREIHLRTAKGKFLTVLANIIPFEYDGERCRLSALVDVTDLRAAERALVHAQRLEAVGRLTGGLAHDFNNLLMTIQISLELLKEDDFPPTQAPYIDTALTAVQRGGDLTHRLLAFSRQQLLKPLNMDVNERIREFFPILRSSVGDTVSVNLELQNGLWAVEVDAAQFDTALLNLVINARDAMPQGGPIIVSTANDRLEEDWRSSVSGEPHIGEFVRVSVSDRGHGIEEEAREKLFEPFYTTKAAGKGTGLGLSMVYGFVQQSGGTVEVDSAPGNGATFNLYFPRSRTDTVAPAALPSASRKIGSYEDGERTILLVDDDNALRLSLTRFLEQSSLKVVACADAHEALARLEEGLAPDLVLTDVALPGNFNGLELAARARRMMPECPILCMTGHVDPEEISGLGDISDFEVLHKPFPISRLMERLDTLLKTAGSPV